MDGCRTFPFLAALLFCFFVATSGQSWRRRISSRSRVVTKPPIITTTTAPPEEEEEEEAPRGYSVDTSRTRDIYRELLDGQNKLSDRFKDQFMRSCKRKNSDQGCWNYYSGVIHAKAKIFYKFGVGMEEYEEVMSSLLEKCIEDLDSIQTQQSDDDDMDSEGERFNRWRTCLYNETIHTWFMGSIGEVKLQFLLVCPGSIQRCLTVFDDKLTTVLSYVYDNYEVSLADLHSRTAQIVFKCSQSSSALRMYPFRRCIDKEAKTMDGTVRAHEPKRTTYG